MYKQEKSPALRDGGWNMRDIQFVTGGGNLTWSALLVNKDGQPDNCFPNPQSLKTTLQNFHNALLGIGINISPPQMPTRVQIGKFDYANIDAAIAAPKVKLLIVVIPAVETTLYKRIKHVGDVSAGVHTICVVAQKFAKGDPQYFANVALKFNLKLGGVNQVLATERLGLIKEDKTMVVGIDVTHPAPGSAKNAPSVAGMVASIDRYLGQWPGDLRIQEPRQEMVADLGSMLKSRLQLWKQKGKHASLPENILVYRDGVSEGQYASVVEHELPLLRKACAESYLAADTKKGLPRLAIVVVGKRHHTRFYPTKAGDADRHSNTKNGTVVDRGVTEARNWDFFLQAHSALQGTARPAHYHVVLDEIFTNRKVSPPFQNVADVLEDLTHSMCYTFGRATKAVSICPPAYYADILCERGRCYLSRMFDKNNSAAVAEARPDEVAIHPALKNSMFYI
jgi:eukaryotic translation initiation factor 2C